MTLTGVVRRIHLWAGVILGVQMMLWMLSGVVMTWFHIELVRGERDAPPAAATYLEAADYVAPRDIIARAGAAESIELRAFLDQPVYEVHGPLGSALYDARSGALISPIAAEAARAVATRQFSGEATIADLSLLDDPPQEYRGVRPVWRAQFNDALNTRLYISPDTGAVRARRNDIWRLYDFFWMLHIMDYGERHDFNNPLVRAASAGGLLFAVSGLFMIFFKNSRRLLAADFRVLTGRGRGDKA